jgi:hypothetical protein
MFQKSCSFQGVTVSSGIAWPVGIVLVLCWYCAGIVLALSAIVVFVLNATMKQEDDKKLI